jgi:uncharacterized protein GlcG (DUF336 family)
VRLPICLGTDSLPDVSALDLALKTNPEESPMIRSLTTLGALTLAAATTTVFAQQPGQQPPPARGVDMALALEAAQDAVNTCLSQGVKGSAAVLDSAGVTRVLISANGSSKNSAELSPKKAVAAIEYKKPTSELQAEADKDPALKAKLEADKNIFPRGGALPIMAGNDLIGAIGFGGANGQQGGGTHDEACAKAGLDKIRTRVK